MDRLKLELLRLLASKQQPLVQLLGDVVDRLQPGMNALGDGLPDLVDEALHLEVLERRADDDVREERRRRERDEDGRRNDGEGAEPVEAELVPGEGGLAGNDELRGGRGEGARGGGGRYESALDELEGRAPRLTGRERRARTYERDAGCSHLPCEEERVLAVRSSLREAIAVLQGRQVSSSTRGSRAPAGGERDAPLRYHGREHQR